jgi:DNA-binding NarL/FixJ family response regulator
VIRPRVILADDHTLLLEAFQKLLADVCDVVGTATDGHALIAAAVELRPDIAVVDIAMPVLNGLDAARQLKVRVPDTRVIFLTMSEDPSVAAEAFRAGASAFLLKRSAASELTVAIREVMLGRSYVTPLVLEGMADHIVGRPAAVRPLTPRQREIVQLIAEGRSMKEAAAVLNITPRTVAFHKYRVMTQLNVKTTAELIQYAIKHGIV